MLTFDVGDMCRNMYKIHQILSEIDEKKQTSFASKMRRRVDHGHM